MPEARLFGNVYVLAQPNVGIATSSILIGQGLCRQPFEIDFTDPQVHLPCPENNLRAAMKALSDVVAPAVDPADPMAREQLVLVVAFLEYTRAHVYDIHGRERYGLRHQLAMADALVADARALSETAGARLAAVIVEARATLEDPESGTTRLRDASERLGATVRGVIREARGADPETRSRIERTVLETSEPLLTLHRRWSAPLGFDPDPSTLPSLQSLLGGAAARRHVAATPPARSPAARVLPRWWE